MMTMFLPQKTRLQRSPVGKKSRTNHRKKLFGITEEMLQKNIYFLQKNTQKSGKSQHQQREGLRSSATAADTLVLTRTGRLRVFPHELQGPGGHSTK